MHGKLVGIGALVIGACFMAPSFGAVIIANNAGSTPATAEDLTGLYPTEIVGQLDGMNQNDVNMFELDIMQAFDFSAITVDAGPYGIPDTVLSLFDSNGVGVYLNDDITPSNTLSCLPSSDAENPCPTSAMGLGPVGPGIYYLAISRGANYPVDSMSNEIFSPVDSTDVVGNSNSNPVAGWDGGAYTSPNFDLVNYDILLTGTLPEPGTFLLTFAAGLGLLTLRRKRAR